MMVGVESVNAFGEVGRPVSAGVASPAGGGGKADAEQVSKDGWGQIGGEVRQRGVTTRSRADAVLLEVGPHNFGVGGPTVESGEQWPVGTSSSGHGPPAGGVDTLLVEQSRESGRKEQAVTGQEEVGPCLVLFDLADGERVLLTGHRTPAGHDA
jgi:hypothetical protein